MKIPRNRLTRDEYRILEMVDVFIKDNAYPPSMREICDKAGISSTSVVRFHLERLERFGYITRAKIVARGIRLIKLPAKFEEAV